MGILEYKLNSLLYKARIIVTMSFFQVLHPLSMRPAREGDIPVRVKNSYNPKAPGTLITRTRDMAEVYSSWIWCQHYNLSIRRIQTRLTFSVSFLSFSVLNSISGCSNQHSFEAECYHVGYCKYTHAWSSGFPCHGEKERLLVCFCFWHLMPSFRCDCSLHGVLQVFSIFEDLGISVDVVATSEVSISLTLDPSKLWSRELIQQASMKSYRVSVVDMLCVFYLWALLFITTMHHL